MKKTIIIFLALACTFVLGYSIGKGFLRKSDQTELVTPTDKSSEEAVGGSSKGDTGASAPGAFSKIEFEKQDFNFGEVKKGKKAAHTFKFRNTGSAPLKIEKVQPSCSCTVPSFTKEEVPVGGEGFVTLEYDSKKPGVFKKTATVLANTDPKNIILQIMGEVVD